MAARCVWQTAFGDACDSFWSSSVVSDSADEAFYIHWRGGSVSTAPRSHPALVRCVRSAD
jgi:hypothetical protein